MMNADEIRTIRLQKAVYPPIHFFGLDILIISVRSTTSPATDYGILYQKISGT